MLAKLPPRPPILSDRHHPIMLKFLRLFGLKDWDDPRTWTKDDLKDTPYLELRPKLDTLCFPRTRVRKMGITDPKLITPKMLITLLSELANLYGYQVKSHSRDLKPNKHNGLDKKKCFQVYHLEMVI